MGDEYERVPLRTVRVPDELWDAAKAVAKERGVPVSVLIRDALERVVKRGK